MFEFREQGEPDPHTIGFTTAVAGSPMEESDWSAVSMGISWPRWNIKTDQGIE